MARFGDDSTIVFPRIGAKALPFEKYSKQDTMQTTGRVLKAAKRMMDDYPTIKKVFIKVDYTGVGGGVTYRIK